MRFKGKTAIVTGAARGIGLACARRFAEEGATVVLSDIDEEGLAASVTELAAEGFDVHAIRADVSVIADIDALVAQTVRQIFAQEQLLN